MKRVNFRRVFVVAGLTALIIVYVVLWLRMITSQAERTGSDFISSYTAGRIAQRWGAANIYNLELQQTVQAEVVGFNLAPGQVLMFNHPPYLLPLLGLLVNGDYITSLVRYMLVMLAFYAVSAVVITWLLRRAGWEHQMVLLTLAGVLTFYPLFVSLVNTQDTAIMLFGACLWLTGLLAGRDWLAGLGLALTTVRPHITVLLAVPFLFRRQKVFGWFCAGVSILGLVTLLAVGVDGLKSYVYILLTVAGGNFYGMKEPAMVNLVGLLWRILPSLGGDVIHWVGWTVYGLAIVGLCVLWACSREIGGKQIGLAVTLAVFAVPHLHYHDLTLLLVALVAALVGLVRGGFLRQQDANLAPLALSLILLLGSLVPILKLNLSYLVMILLVLLLWSPQKLFFRTRKKQEVP